MHAGHAVAEEEGRADQDDHDGEPEAAPGLRPVRGGLAVGVDEREQREDPALPVVVGLRDEAEVLDADDEDERPEYQREYAEQSVHAGPGRQVRDALLHCI